MCTLHSCRLSLPLPLDIKCLNFSLKIRNWKMFHLEWRTSSCSSSCDVATNLMLSKCHVPQNKNCICKFWNSSFHLLPQVLWKFCSLQKLKLLFWSALSKNLCQTKTVDLKKKTNHHCTATDFHVEENYTIESWIPNCNPKQNAPPLEGPCPAAALYEYLANPVWTV